jgi:hypothetical protein
MARTWNPSVLPLVLWVAAMASIAAGAAALLPWSGPSLDFAHGNSVAAHISDRALTPLPVIQNAAGAWPLLIAFLLGFALACWAYVAVLRAPNLSLRHVWFAFGLGVVAVLAIPFFPTSDPYAYALYALEAGPLHLNPYASVSLAGSALPWAAPLAALFPDPAAYVRQCNYGPVAVFAYAALALPLAHQPLLAFLYAERFFGAVCVAVAGALLASGGADADRAKRLASYVLHPLVLCEFVAFAHGDALMLALLAAAFVCWRREAFGWAAALCVAAVATRSVAVLALLAIVLVLLRDRPRALPRALGGALLAACAIGAASLAAFGEVSLGGAPAFNRFASPLSFAATLFDGSAPLVTAVFAQAALGIALAAIVVRRWWLRRDGLAWLSFAALAGLPAIYPHYLGWVAGVAATRPGPRLEAVARVATFAAPLWYVARMNLITPPQPSELAYGLALALTWGSALLALVLLRIPGAAGLPSFLRPHAESA